MLKSRNAPIERTLRRVDIWLLIAWIWLVGQGLVSAYGISQHYQGSAEEEVYLYDPMPAPPALEEDVVYARERAK